MIGFSKLGGYDGNDIFSLTDSRLVVIDPTSKDFFTNVFTFVPEDHFPDPSPELERSKNFIAAIHEIQMVGIRPFWKPIYDPSLSGEMVFFAAGHNPAVGISYNDWKYNVSQMKMVEGKKWSIGTDYQYYLFLVYLINSLVNEGWTITDAIFSVILYSRKLGNYLPSKEREEDVDPEKDNWDHVLYFNKKSKGIEFENTGSRKVCEFYDLANTFKMLSPTYDIKGYGYSFITAGGNCYVHDIFNPLADINYRRSADTPQKTSVAWLVLQ